MCEGNSNGKLNKDGFALLSANKYITRQTKTPQLDLSGWIGLHKNSSFQLSSVEAFPLSSSDFALRYDL